MKKILSFVIPCYRSEKTIEKVIDEIISVVSQKPEYDYEIIAVNDCSPDNVYSVLVKLAKKNKKVKVINFAKNVGKNNAILAGLSVVNGDYIIMLDDDFQCPINELWKLLKPLEDNACDVVSAKYYEKKESLFKRLGSFINSVTFRYLLDIQSNIRMENFLALKRFVADEMIKYKKPYPYIEGLIFKITQNVINVNMEERGRADNNKSGFTYKKSVSMFLDGFTAFSVKPLRVSSFVGVSFAFLGFIYIIYTLIQKFIDPTVPIGYSALVSILMFSNGIVMLLLGLIGEYLGRIYISINEFPQYVFKDVVNIDDDSKEKSEKI